VRNQETFGVGLSGYHIIWKFITGDLHWYHFEVKEIEYNKLARY